MNVTKEEILAIVENVGVSVDVSTIKVDVPFKQAGIDSLEMMNVFLGIEEKFGIQIHDEDIADLNTIENIVSYLQKI